MEAGAAPAATTTTEASMSTTTTTADAATNHLRKSMSMIRSAVGDSVPILTQGAHRIEEVSYSRLINEIIIRILCLSVVVY